MKLARRLNNAHCDTNPNISHIRGRQCRQHPSSPTAITRAGSTVAGHFDHPVVRRWKQFSALAVRFLAGGLTGHALIAGGGSFALARSCSAIASVAQEGLGVSYGIEGCSGSECTAQEWSRTHKRRMILLTVPASGAAILLTMIPYLCDQTRCRRIYRRQRDRSQRVQRTYPQCRIQCEHPSV